MQNTFTITINQVLMMFSFMVIGYIMRKKKLGGDSLSTVLSTLIVDIFLPAMTFASFASNFHIDTLAQNLPFLIAGTVILAITFLMAKGLSSLFAQTPLQRDIYMYSFLIPNLGYMGYPLIGSVFGEQMLFNMMIFVIPYNIAIYTYGMYILNPKRELSIKKIINPTMVAMVLGMLVGIFYIKLPPFLDSAISAAKGCMSPCAMLLTGFILASAPLRDIMRDIRLYLAAFVRALLIPGIALGVLYLLHVDNLIIVIAVATLCMPMGLNSVVFPEAYGGDGLTGAKTTFVSNIVSIITIPLVFMVLGMFL